MKSSLRVRGRLIPVELTSRLYLISSIGSLASKIAEVVLLTISQSLIVIAEPSAFSIINCNTEPERGSNRLILTIT